ncbi:MAG TPA: hypothetical protein VH107_02855 [Lacipirellulaceae bacterium]|jgi:hypothetical protein|nr:hypothetical protein [Lacipirellulaceae bacterium]
MRASRRIEILALTNFMLGKWVFRVFDGLPVAEYEAKSTHQLRYSQF